MHYFNFQTIVRPLKTSFWRVVLGLCCAAAAPVSYAEKMCGDEGVWVQILGAGGPEIQDARAGASFLVWHDGVAKVMVDTGPGASVGFDQAEANFQDLDAIAFTHLQADHAGDLPGLLTGSAYVERTRPLAILGPNSSNPQYPGIEEFLNRLIGPQGAFAYMQDYLTPKSSAGYRISVRPVPATGKKRWSRFANDTVKLSAIPVNHGDVPTLAWRVEIDGTSVVFTGDFNNLKNVMADFAEGADALVANHAIHENARGNLRELYALPSQLGKVAERADARMLILAHRMDRTRGRESLTRKTIEEHYNGHILFADDLECWGL